MIWSVLTEHWWLPLVCACVSGHATISVMSLYLHRDQTHGGLTIRAPVSHIMRFWLWLTTGLNTREWVACHRKHHAFTDEPEDPHSPVNHGLMGIMLLGVYYYRRTTKNLAVLEKYGKGVVNDWLERYFFTKLQYVGVLAMLAIDIVLFDIWFGLLVWAIQMAWTPFWAAGVVNGVGHFLGYRNYNVRDKSRNIVPFGILLGGEELHNNHHKYPASSKFSTKWFEFDMGWIYIRLLVLCRMAKVKWSDMNAESVTGKSLPAGKPMSEI